MKPEFVLPTQAEIVEVLRRHPLVKLRESVKHAFVVGSFAKGAQNDESDVDVLLEVQPRDGFEASELEEHYRRLLREHFMRYDIRGKDDSVHPQWCGRRVDVYFTYDASLEGRPKVLLPAPQPAARRRARP
jgi:predicted nucleotidyltransferase